MAGKLRKYDVKSSETEGQFDRGDTEDSPKVEEGGPIDPWTVVEEWKQEVLNLESDLEESRKELDNLRKELSLAQAGNETLKEDLESAIASRKAAQEKLREFQVSYNVMSNALATACRSFAEGVS